MNKKLTHKSFRNQFKDKSTLFISLFGTNKIILKEIKIVLIIKSVLNRAAFTLLLRLVMIQKSLHKILKKKKLKKK